MKFFSRAAFALMMPLAALASTHLEKASPVGVNTADNAGKNKLSAGSSAKVTHGEIKKIDKDIGKVTLKHNPVMHLEMPAMTMVFKVKNPDQLTRLDPGDEVDFILERISGELVVTDIRKTD
jgi:Cu(I)/Ag(I) efflux system protein CusF